MERPVAPRDAGPVVRDFGARVTTQGTDYVVDWINEQLTLLGSVVPATKLDKCMSHFEKWCLCIQ